MRSRRGIIPLVSGVGCLAILGVLASLSGRPGTYLPAAPGGTAYASDGGAQGASPLLSLIQPPDEVDLTDEMKAAERMALADLDGGKKEEADRLRNTLQPRFDEFSWKMFIALNWPAEAGKRGVADRSKPFGERRGDLTLPVVWDTWKSDFELLQSGHPPSPWDSCGCVTPDSDGRWIMDGGMRKCLAACTKFSDLLPDSVGQAGFLVADNPAGYQEKPPLIDRAGKYVRYEVRMNRVQYEFIVRNKYYLMDELKLGIHFPPTAREGGNSIEIKAAWRELPNDPQVLRRFYTRDAVIIDMGRDRQSVRRESKVGLVGLHIVTKTPSRN